MNAGIQGLAADIFKVALVRIDEALRGERRRQPARPAGPRRGARRGARRRARRRSVRSSIDLMRHAAAPRRAARGQRRRGAPPGPTPSLKIGDEPVRSQTGGCEPDHWFEPIAEHLGVGVPAVLVHEGDACRRSTSSSTTLGLAAGDAGARRRLRARAACARAGPARDRRARHRHQPAVRRPGRRRRPAGCDVRAARCPGDAVRRRVRRRDLPVPGRLRADDRRRRERRRCSPGSPRR